MSDRKDPESIVREIKRNTRRKPQGRLGREMVPEESRGRIKVEK